MPDLPRETLQIDEAYRYVRCEKCGRMIDNLNVKQVLDHERPLPHIETPEH